MPAGRDAAAEPPTELDPPIEPDEPPGVGLVEPGAALPVVPVRAPALPDVVALPALLMLLVARSQHCVDDPDAPGAEGEGVVGLPVP